MKDQDKNKDQDLNNFRLKDCKVDKMDKLEDQDQQKLTR